MLIIYNEDLFLKKTKLIETELLESKKYTSVTIPVDLWIRIHKVVDEKAVFKSVSDYVAFVLREIVIMHEEPNCYDPFSSKDLEGIMKHLEALGAL